VRALTAFLLSLLASVSLAEPYPSRPLRLIVPLSPGATTDVVMRATAQMLSPRLGQPIVVENRPGGNWVIGAGACLNAPADGHTLCLVNSDAMAFNPHVLSKLPYDPAQDFVPVTNLFFLFEGILAKSALPVSDIPELRAYARGANGKLNFGTFGPGSSNDVFRQWLTREWQVDMTGIPYKGGGNLVAALLAGEIDLTKVGMGNLAGQLDSGRIKVLAIQGTKRSRILPGVPTLSEAGLGAFDMRVWWGLVMKAGSPGAAVRRINAELVKLYREPKMAEYLESQFVEVAVGAAEDFGRFMAAERERAAEAVKAYTIPRQ